MSLEMSPGSFEYAMQVTRNGRTIDAFFEILGGDQKYHTSELYRGITKMLTKYVEHLKNEAGERWRHEDAVQQTLLWRRYAAYILAGLYAIYGRNFPSLRPGRIEVLERECDAPQSILDRMILDYEKILCSFGEVSRVWIRDFRLCTDYSSSFLCGRGIFSIYALAVALVVAKEDQGDDASLSDAERQDVARRDARLGPIKKELEEVLEKMQF